MSTPVDDLTIDINIEGDGGKKIDAIIGKFKTLNVEVGKLNKSLKSTDSGFSMKGPSVGSTSSAAAKTPKEKTELQVRAESLKMARLELGEKRVAISNQKIKENQDKKEEKEEDKRRKERDKDAKKFFGTIQSGFKDTAKIALGAIGAGTGIVGIGIAAASQAQGIASAGSQQGINSQSLQRWRNVLTQAGGIGSEGATQEIVNLQAKLNQNQYTGELVQGLSQLNLPADTKDVFALMDALRTKSTDLAPGIRTGLFGQLGISPGAVNAFNPETFSDKQFQEAYNLPILSDEALESNKKLVIALDKLRIIFENTIGKLLSKAEPKISKISDAYSHPEIPENAAKIKNMQLSAQKYGLMGAGIGALGGLFGVAIGGVGGAAYGMIHNAEGIGPHSVNTLNLKRANKGNKLNGNSFFKIRRIGGNDEEEGQMIAPNFDDSGAQINVPLPTIAEAIRSTSIHNDNSQIINNVKVEYNGGTREQAEKFARDIPTHFILQKPASQYDSKPTGQ
ncbi:MAG: hypothetical protein ACRC6O_13175 [Flavobacterium sp.]